MPIDIPPRGAVFEYPYRWAREVSEGASPDGRTDRTVCLVLTVAVSAHRHILYLLAISSKPPREGQVAIPIPETERRRAGLIRYPDAWVYVSEFNRDVAEEWFYFEPNARRLGAFSSAFVLQVSRALAARVQEGAARAVERSGPQSRPPPSRQTTKLWVCALGACQGVHLSPPEVERRRQAAAIGHAFINI